MGYVASAGGTLSLPQAKFAFLNSQSLDQLSAGASSNDADMTTLEWDKFRECVARCGVLGEQFFERTAVVGDGNRRPGGARTSARRGAAIMGASAEPGCIP